MLRAAVATLAALAVVAACTSIEPAGGSGATVPPPSAEDRSGEPGGASLPAPIIDPIVADAAARLGVDPSAITVVSAQVETFSDGSLGCPKPGEMYTQAIVEGYRVMLDVAGTQLDYRGSAPGRFRICEDP